MAVYTHLSKLNDDGDISRLVREAVHSPDWTDWGVV